MKAPVFSIDFRKGSNISDQCGIGTPTTNVGFLKNTYGYACFNRGITFPLFDIDLSEDFTEIFAFYFYEEGNLYSDSVIKIEGNERNPYLRINTIKTNRTLVLTYMLSSGVAFNVMSIPIVKNKTYFVAFTHNKALRTFNVYINNILYSYTYPSNHNFNKLNSTPIVKPSTSNRIGFYFMKVYDYILNKNDIDKLYEEFIHSKPTFKPINNFKYPKPTIVNEEGLVAAYNMIPINKILPNIAAVDSPHKYMRNLLGQIRTVRGILTNKNSDLYLAFRFNNQLDLGKKCSYSFILNNLVRHKIQNNNYSYSIELYNNYIGIRVGSIFRYSKIFSFTIPKNSCNVFTLIRDNFEYVLYCNGKIIGSLIHVDNSNTIFYGYEQHKFMERREIIEERFYDRVLTENEIIEYNNKFASQIVLYEDFSNYPIDSKTKHILNTGWSVKELLYNKDLLNKGNKYLTSYGSGRWFGISNNNRYGTFEFDILINTYNNSNKIYFISPSFKTTHLGYAIGFDISDPSKISISKNINTFMLSTNYSLQLNVFYHIKVEADINNTFKLYVNNIYLGTSTVDSTYLTTNIFKFTSGSFGGMYVSNIKIKQGIVIQ